MDNYLCSGNVTLGLAAERETDPFLFQDGLKASGSCNAGELACCEERREIRNTQQKNRKRKR